MCICVFMFIYIFFLRSDGEDVNEDLEVKLEGCLGNRKEFC